RQKLTAIAARSPQAREKRAHFALVQGIVRECGSKQTLLKISPANLKAGYRKRQNEALRRNEHEAQAEYRQNVAGIHWVADNGVGAILSNGARLRCDRKG